MKVKKVIYKKIPQKENAVGFAYNDKIKDPKKKLGTIEIEKNQTPLNILDTEIHELIHMYYPEIPEQSVLQMGSRISRYLFKLGYRKLTKR